MLGAEHENVCDVLLEAGGFKGGQELWDAVQEAEFLGDFWEGVGEIN